MVAVIRLVGLLLLQSAKFLQLGAVLVIALKGGRRVYAR